MKGLEIKMNEKENFDSIVDKLIASIESFDSDNIDSEVAEESVIVPDEIAEEGLKELASSVSGWYAGKVRKLKVKDHERGTYENIKKYTKKALIVLDKAYIKLISAKADNNEDKDKLTAEEFKKVDDWIEENIEAIREITRGYQDTLTILNRFDPKDEKTRKNLATKELYILTSALEYAEMEKRYNMRMDEVIEVAKKMTNGKSSIKHIPVVYKEAKEAFENATSEFEIAEEALLIGKKKKLELARDNCNNKLDSIENTIHNKFLSLVNFVKRFSNEDNIAKYNKLFSEIRSIGNTSPMFKKFRLLVKHVNDVENYQSEFDGIINDAEEFKSKKIEELNTWYEKNADRHDKSSAAAASFVLSDNVLNYMRAATEGLEIDPIAFLIGSTVGLFLFNTIGRGTRATANVSPNSKAYYYIMLKDFKNAGKSLKGILKDNNTFKIKKDLLRDTNDIKNKYFPVISRAVNDAMDTFDGLKHTIGKEKMYVFGCPSPVRDNALIEKMNKDVNMINQKLYSYNLGAISGLASPANSNIEYVNNESITVDSTFLSKLLQADEIFRIAEELGKDIEMLPSKDDPAIFARYGKEIALYESLDSNATETKAPIKAYLNYLIELRCFMETVYNALVSYVAAVYEILNYTVICDKNGRPKK